MVFSVMRILSLLPFLLTLFLSKSLLVDAELQEQTILFSINKNLRVPGWNATNSDYCSWNGVTCGHRSLVESLSLSKQNLGGDVSSISMLKALKWLDLSNNNFQGMIPNAFGNLSHLEYLDLSSNKFEGSIPIGFGRLKRLKTLNFSNNMLVGEMPKELQGLESLQEFQIYNNHLSGLIPSWVRHWTNLRVFAAYENHFNGMIPDDLGFISELKTLNLHTNHLEGPIPASLFSAWKLQVLILTQNNLSGEIPEEIGNCQTLLSVRIGNNNLQGNIPKSVGNLTSLAYFEADHNNLSGELVSEFSLCYNLTFLNLASNGLAGKISPEFGKLMNLQVLMLSENILSGDIPEPILQIKSLKIVDLSNNRFNGTIPNEICGTAQLQKLRLNQNFLRGVIPHEIGRCRELVELQLGSNDLTGTIPSQIGHMHNLEIALNLSYNHLEGKLHPELGRINKLGSLDLSNNNLSGKIPETFIKLLNLVVVNISNNQLSGPLPKSAAFLLNPASSYLGNKGLCGAPLNTTCEDQDNPHHYAAVGNNNGISYVTIIYILGPILLAFVLFASTVFVNRMCRRQVPNVPEIIEGGETDTKPYIISREVFANNLTEEVDLGAVVEATRDESNKVSSGNFSAVYKALMPSGIVLFVRKMFPMDMTMMQQHNKIVAELQRLRKLNHENLMKPVGYVICNKFALLIYEYISRGTLAQLLHEPAMQPAYELDWPARISIAIEVANGLGFLHSKTMIHHDISSSNVLLDANLNALIGDIEISKFLDQTKESSSIIPYVGSFGYVPPEYAYTMQVTESGNVYSFGVILLEMITSRTAIDEGVELVKWVHEAAERGESPEEIMDATLSSECDGWRNEMLGTLKLAMLCTDNRPIIRPPMINLAGMLRQIRNPVDVYVA
ncbi:leucine-rich repeat receptor-like tyrosine-protein kinase PXC3 [Vigna unguiculata]|uniref:leucine-rich repeat receptor-like tyrosine-protein kinase PXC3 n=1 Tax=Vigna unguiculata TaxID=3917 RepID=UPI0010161416|nr:leucine-rich repeat receptor-like tyrosine-protein kinase PXC3 [Vigna unguiculata]